MKNIFNINIEKMDCVNFEQSHSKVASKNMFESNINQQEISMRNQKIVRSNLTLLSFVVFMSILGLSSTKGNTISKNTFFVSPQAKQSSHYYACPMHVDVKFDKPGKCSKCGMELLSRNSNQKLINAQISLTTVPNLIKPGVPFLAKLKVTDEKGLPIQQFDVMHEKLLHLIIVSRDLSYFDHLHPTLVGNTFSIKMNVPKAGDYRMYADFVPKGGPHTIGKLDFRSEGTSAPELLKPDTSFTKVFDSIEVTLTPTTFKAGESVVLNFTLKDAKTKTPIKTLQPYLGAMGHCVIIDQSCTEYLHSHPLENEASHKLYKGMETNNVHDEHHHRHVPEKGFGGPEVNFHTQFSKPGIYKAWGQFNYQGKIIAADFTFEVK